MSGPVAVVLVVLVVFAVAALYGLVALTLAPYVLGALVAGLLAGVVLGLVQGTRVLGGLVDTPRVRTPRDEFTGRPTGGLRLMAGDYAWPHYPYRQAGYDLWHVVERCWGLVAGLWRRGWRTVPKVPRYHLRLVDGVTDAHREARTRTWTVLLGWPLLALPFAVLVGLTAGTAAMLVVLAAVVALVTLLASLLGAAVIGVLRATDRRWHHSWATESCCPRCYFMIDLPVFACPGDHPPEAPTGSTRHRLLRAGVHGLWRRRCGCGVSLPARAPAAGVRLSAHCPKCGTALAAGTGRFTEIRVAVFGAPDAGKTRLVDAMVAALAARFPADRCAVARHGFDGRVRPEVVSATISTHRGGQRVHLFDAPGLGLVDREVCSSYSYLDETRHFVFVLDPLSLPTVRRRIAETPGHLAPTVPVARHDPADSYEAVVTGLRHRGVETERCRLAFVLSKGDQLGALLGHADLRSDPAYVRRWLTEHGLDHLTTAVARDFADVGYFLHGLADPSPDPLLWLLRGDRVLRREVLSALH